MKEGKEGAAPLLFSLQIFVDRLSLSKEPPGASMPLLVGFQLLQFEIVLFDRRESEPGGATVTLGHGKSCLFEAAPAALATQLRDEAAAPLVLLLMEQEGDRARLAAFASVALPLHVGLLADGDGPPADMTYRVCEWARGGGTWELRDHRGDRVGEATGAVTLSCLGKSLAPHLAKALGVRVGSASPAAAPSPPALRARADRCDSTFKLKEEGGNVARGERGGEAAGVATESEPKREAIVSDAAVQCDDTGDREGRQSRKGAVCFAGSGQAQSNSLGPQSRRPSGSVNSGWSSAVDRCGSPRLGRSMNGAGRSAREPRPAMALRATRDLPPPLFFQKQPASSKG